MEQPWPDDFNSSDLELGDVDEAVPANRWANTGKASVDKILDSKLEDRVQTKKSSKQLGYANVNLKSEANVCLWINRVQSFREHTLGQDPKTPPTGMDFERFLEAIVPKVIPMGHHLVPSLRWL
ncbi:MAG: hypothetical protein Q9208_000848 [Pyrenodesmia sp. 3 TL-2023]